MVSGLFPLDGTGWKLFIHFKHFSCIQIIKIIASPVNGNYKLPKRQGEWSHGYDTSTKSTGSSTGEKYAIWKNKSSTSRIFKTI